MKKESGNNLNPKGYLKDSKHLGSPGAFTVFFSKQIGSVLDSLLFVVFSILSSLYLPFKYSRYYPGTD